MDTLTWIAIGTWTVAGLILFGLAWLIGFTVRVTRLLLDEKTNRDAGDEIDRIRREYEKYTPHIAPGAPQAPPRPSKPPTVINDETEWERERTRQRGWD